MKDYELDAILASLEEERGGGTWHVSLYIRPHKSVQSVKNRIVQEISEAESIKSDDTRDRVQSSLQKLRDELSTYKQTPDNGMILFASPDQVYVLDELPFECPENRYHCGKEFLLEPIRSSSGADGSYGLIVVERGRAAVAVFDSGVLRSVTERESQVMGKTQAGGQSQTRFERVREKQKHEFFGSVTDLAEQTFSDYELDGVAIGGTIDTAKEFTEKYTRHNWNVIGTYSVDHGDEQGLEELVTKAESDILDEEQAHVRQCVELFLEGVRDDLAEYGERAVSDVLEQGRVETLLLSSNLNVDEIQEYSALAEQYGTSVEVIAPTFEEAEMFENLSNGYGAILRW